MKMKKRIPTLDSHALLLGTFLGALLLPGCTGDDGKDGQDAPVGDTPTELAPADDAPGVNPEIVSLSGGSGAGGNFRVGDRLRVTYRVKKDDGSDWKLSELSLGRALVSGPTTNYQRVLAEQRDLLTASVKNGDGSYTYTWPEPLPATYLPPFNDSPSFGPEDGELSGMPLLGGTYTLAMYFRWEYTVEGSTFRDPGDVVHDFLLGDATTLQPRAVVGQENCNACHTDLQAHGGSRHNVTLCLLCHTAGAEDANSPSVAGGTPGVTIAFEVMIHRIHNGAHLPSVLGMGTLAGGMRDYAVAPKPFLVASSRSVHDYSEVSFPAWPNLNIATPRDMNYSALDAGAKAKEDAVRTGITGCYVCHGDPDGSGPIQAPAQGSIAYSQPARATCGSCHDDIDWSTQYRSNTNGMPAQPDDSGCTECHMPSGDPLAVMDAHLHPLLDPNFDPGLNFELLSVNKGANVNPGDNVELTFNVLDDSGAEVLPAGLGMNVAISGPNSNMNLVHYVALPAAALTGDQPFTVNVPELVWYEFVGRAMGGQDMLQTQRFPHWDLSGAATDVLTAALVMGGGDSSLAAAVTGPVNYIDVANVDGFLRNDVLVLDRGSPEEEYLKIQYVSGNRLWFSSLYSSGYTYGPRFEHPLGAPVEEVELTPQVRNTNYSLNAADGVVTELADSFVDGDAVLVTYTTDFVMPDRYPVSLNGSPDLGQDAGEWNGLPIVAGTYSLGLWGSYTKTLSLYGESNSYRITSPGLRQDFLVGNASQVEPYDLISSAQNCYDCHQDIWFHGGGRRGYDTCVMCHGNAGTEDRPPYIAGMAPETRGLTVNFRTMLHKIHQGKELANASSYTVVGFGATPYPNNYTPHGYAEVGFPAFTGGTMQCARCHGESEAWMEPAPRSHPQGQSVSTRSWTFTCGSCHDSDPAQAHIEIMTSTSGNESCAICHSLEDELNVPLMHKVR